MSVLVVDDNALLASKVARSLGRAGHGVRTATSLAQAREILERQPPRVICLDLQLPDGNGFDFLEGLRRDGRNLPVIVVSGHHSPENRARAKQLGAAGFLAKPFALSELHGLVAALLGDARAAEAAESPGREPGVQPATVGAEPALPRTAATTRNRPRAPGGRLSLAGSWVMAQLFVCQPMTAGGLGGTG